MDSVLHQLNRHRIVPVVTAHSAEQGLRIAEALAEGGLPVAEITFRTGAAPDAIAEIAERGEVLEGAGNARRHAQVSGAVATGATERASHRTHRSNVSHATKVS